MSDSSLPIDFTQRQQALNPSQSFICEAPAGSGKTELLTQRVLTLLARVDKPEALLAITFTRKAAAEMRERILHALHRGQGQKPHEPHAQATWQLAQAVLLRDADLGWSILQNPNRLQIRTFDSLCAMLTQTLPIHSSLGVNVHITEDASILYREAVAQLLETLEQPVPWAEALRILLQHLDNQFSRVDELLVKMLQSRDAWMPIIHSGMSGEEVRDVLELHLQHVVEDKISRLKLLIPDNLKATLFRCAGFAASNLRQGNSQSPITFLQGVDIEQVWPDQSELGLMQWAGLAQLLLTQKLEWRKRLDKNAGFPVGGDRQEKAAFLQQKQVMQDLLQELASVPDLLQALQDVSYWPTQTYQAAQWQVLQALTTVLPVLVAHMQLVFRARGEVDFLEMSARARQALGDEYAPTELALRLDYKIQHILVDEFQDTSFHQVELIQKLTAGWQAEDGRTLFCVGDAMQSIYSFRGANVGLFLHSRQHGLGNIPLTPLQLSTNFRSQAAIVQWINSTFRRAFPAQHDISTGAVAFADADDFRPPLSGEAVKIHAYLPEQDQLQGECVLRIIEQTRNESPDATIAILVRNRSHVADIIPTLKKAGLRFRALDLEPLAEQEAIVDLLSLTRALLSPADRIAWLSVLRAPWCGLSLADLHCVSNQINASKDDMVLQQIMRLIYSNDSHSEYDSPAGAALSAHGIQLLHRVSPLLHAAIVERERKPLRQWVEGIWLALGGAACLQLAADAENVERYFQLLESLSIDGGVPNLEQLQHHLQKLYAAPDPYADDRLQIMTIHKSKGLEFDAVILPGLHRQPRSADQELLLWQERLSLRGNEEWLLAPLSPVGQDKDPIYRHLEREHKKRQEFEACRLLYVACTRAKKRLHLLAQVKLSDDETLRFKEPASASLLSYIWPAVAATIQLIEFGDAVDIDTVSTVEAVVPNQPLRRLPQNWCLPSFAEGHLLDEFIPPFEFDNQNTQMDWEQQQQSNMPRQIGTLVHQVLQTIGEQGIAHWQERDLTSCLSAWQSRLIFMGLTHEQAAQAVPQVQTCIRQALNNAHFLWLLKGDCQFEYPLSHAMAGSVQHKVIDVLRCEGEQAWVVDYKTSCPTQEQNREEFIQKEIQKYQKSMNLYCQLVEKLGFGHVRAALFFPMLGHWQAL